VWPQLHRGAVGDGGEADEHLALLWTGLARHEQIYQLDSGYHDSFEQNEAIALSVAVARIPRSTVAWVTRALGRAS
jgi:hypothetical protein